MKNPEIAQFVKFEMDERSKRTRVTADRVIEELGRIAFFDIRKAFRPDGTLMSVDEMDADARAVIVSLDVHDLHDREGNPTGRMSKVKLADKLGALTLLMRHMGLLNDKVKIQGDADNPLALLIREVQGSSLKPVPTHLLEREDCVRPIQ
ncbi:MAG: terminase small subunit [Pseudomonadota bacterium]